MGGSKLNTMYFKGGRVNAPLSQKKILRVPEISWDNGNRNCYRKTELHASLAY